eukprot:3166383-Alexandrium_andersonii.AAC.1
MKRVFDFLPPCRCNIGHDVWCARAWRTCHASENTNAQCAARECDCFTNSVADASRTPLSSACAAPINGHQGAMLGTHARNPGTRPAAQGCNRQAVAGLLPRHRAGDSKKQ